MTEGQTARIRDREYPYTLRPEDGVYVFEIDGARYRFRQWLWGEKNRVIDAATVTEAGGSVRVDLARFNELMLATSLVDADGLKTVTPQALRQLNPVLGDTLLALAYWVNELPPEKKKLDRGAPARRTAPRPGHLPAVPGIRLDPTAGPRAACRRGRRAGLDPRRARPSVGAGAAR